MEVVTKEQVVEGTLVADNPPGKAHEVTLLSVRILLQNAILYQRPDPICPNQFYKCWFYKWMRNRNCETNSAMAGTPLESIYDSGNG